MGRGKDSWGAASIRQAFGNISGAFFLVANWRWREQPRAGRVIPKQVGLCCLRKEDGWWAWKQPPPTMFSTVCAAVPASGFLHWLSSRTDRSWHQVFPPTSCIWSRCLSQQRNPNWDRSGMPTVGKPDWASEGNGCHMTQPLTSTCLWEMKTCVWKR